MEARIEARLRLTETLIELSTGESFQTAVIGILWSRVAYARRYSLADREPVKMGGLQVMEISEHGDIYVKTALDHSAYRVVIRFAEIEAIVVSCDRPEWLIHQPHELAEGGTGVRTA